MLECRMRDPRDWINRVRILWAGTFGGMSYCREDLNVIGLFTEKRQVFLQLLHTKKENRLKKLIFF